MTRDAEHTPSPQSVVDWSEYQDDISDAISDSIDMDWSANDGARAVVRWLNENAPYAAPAPSSLAGGAFDHIHRLAVEFNPAMHDIDQVLSEINQIALAALSPEAPAREGVASDLLNLKEQFERIAAKPAEEQPCYASGVRPFGTGDLRHFIETLTVAAAALTPRHEAPFFIKDGEDPAEFRALGKRLADTDQEAPAEGAGEEVIDGIEDVITQFVKANPGSEPDVYGEETAAEMIFEKFIRPLLRARSSAPEAREGEAPVGWVKNGARHVIWWGAEYPVHGEPGEYDALYAAPSADKLRIAVEALEASLEYAPPLSLAPKIRQALAALKAGGGK